MKRSRRTSVWSLVIDRAEGPLYLAIADAIAADMMSGTLEAGTRLPAQRALAKTLGVDFTTVSRAYAEARKRGLVEGRVGQGTYIRARRASAPPTDMSMNLPPRFHDPALSTRMWQGIGGLERSGGLDLLLRYQEAGGAPRDRAAGAQWLAPRVPSLSEEQVLVAPGAQSALLVIANLLARPGDTICTEALTYPGLRALAAHLGIRLVGVPMDDEGIDPEAFAALCRESVPRALYCTPTLHNPTTTTMPRARRAAVVEVARLHGVPIIEDDAYGALPAHPPPSFAALAPDLTFHVAGLAKCLSPALRIAYVVAPSARETARLAGALRATATMASPLTAAIATGWIEDGTAEALRNAIRAESAARQAIAARLLPKGAAAAHPEGFHVWLKLPPPWTRMEFTQQLRADDIGVVASDAFALGAPPEAVRLGLGAAASREAVERGLRRAANLLEELPAFTSAVV